MLDEPVWGGWALDRHTAEELAAYLNRARPKTIVEAGSGSSTLLLAEYASRTGASVTSLEHSDRHGTITRTALEQRDLDRFVDLRVRPLTDVDTPAGPAKWYSSGLPSGIDFALIDGPPGAVGRGAALFVLLPLMREEGPDTPGDCTAGSAAWEIWLDDANRDGERACADLWRSHLLFRDEYIPSPKGLLRITPVDRAAPRRPVDASDVTVTLLTGGRPDLLAETIHSIRTRAPGLLETAHVAVLHNGAADDAETAAMIEGWAWADHVTRLEERLSVGQAAAALLSVSAPRPYTLHLEDDWTVATLDTTWLDAARAALDDPEIGQVRLRHRGETVLKNHMVTRRPIWWQDGPAGTRVAIAHYTLNPSLMRSVDTPKVWPAADELLAAKQFYALGLSTAQVVPGVFRHIGDGASLRLGQRP